MERIKRADLDRIAGTISWDFGNSLVIQIQGRNGYFAADLYSDGSCVDTLTIGTKAEVYNYLQGVRRCQLIADKIRRVNAR